MKRLVLILSLALNWIPVHAATGGSSDGLAGWKSWQAQRREDVAGTNGWSTLVGLSWLREGANSAGADATNDVRLAEGRAADHIGTFVREGKAVRFEAAAGTTARVNGKPVRSTALISDAAGEPTKLLVGDLEITVIARGERLGLRIRDPEAPARRHFRGLEYFPYDPSWRIQGRFEHLPQPAAVLVDDVTGAKQEMQSPGAVVFGYAGAEYRLQVMEEMDATDYLVLFRDQTAGKETYPSGRFVHIDKPNARGEVVIDFNRAYNPPCGFTSYATCPLPPRRNWLPFAVRAGELVPPGH